MKIDHQNGGVHPAAESENDGTVSIDATVRCFLVSVKKPVMRRSITILLITAMLMSGVTLSCKKNKFMATGAITGFDLRKCGCCGGLMINFDGNTQAYTGDFWLIKNNPAELGIDTATAFPVHVKIDYERIASCGSPTIKVTRFARQ